MSDYINIEFPFKDSSDGLFVNLNKDSNNAIKSNLIHLLLTNKGERFYLPDFGTNLKKYIFNQNDNISENEIRDEINLSISKYLPNLKITNLSVNPSTENNLTVIVNIDYVVTDDVFQTNESLTLKL